VGRREELVMPDTGAPWNIPYAAPADLVRDWPDLSEDVADAVAAGLSAAGNPGIGSNVVETVKTDTFTTSSTSFTTVTGLSATITPSSDTAKILVIAQVVVSQSVTNNVGVHLRLSGGNATDYVGDTASNRVRVISTFGNFGSLWDTMLAVPMVYLDSPAVATPVTYSVEVRVDTTSGGSALVNRSGTDTDNNKFGRAASSITVIEVAA
jgi:hypothetical protein